MDKVTIYKNKNETFKCNFDIEGAVENIQPRLCLHLGNKSIVFTGEINKEGDCIFQIPMLPEVKDTAGTLAVEVIADSVYFKVFECDLELKKSVEVKISEITKTDSTPQRKVDLTEIKQMEKVPEKKEIKFTKTESITPPEPKSLNGKFKNFKNYLDAKKPS